MKAKDYVRSHVFILLRKHALDLGFLCVPRGPLVRNSCKIKEQSIENALKKMKGVTILTTDATGMQNVVVENLKLWTYFYFCPYIMTFDRETGGY